MEPLIPSKAFSIIICCCPVILSFVLLIATRTSRWGKTVKNLFSLLFSLSNYDNFPVYSFSVPSWRWYVFTQIFYQPCFWKENVKKLKATWKAKKNIFRSEKKNDESRETNLGLPLKKCLEMKTFEIDVHEHPHEIPQTIQRQIEFDETRTSNIYGKRNKPVISRKLIGFTLIDKYQSWEWLWVALL